jgi:hypothetical protein
MAHKIGSLQQASLQFSTDAMVPGLFVPVWRPIVNDFEHLDELVLNTGHGNAMSNQFYIG